jgi:hypothetical protein
MDIDIDFADPRQVMDNLPCVPALGTDGRRHLSGVYFQDIPVNPVDGLAVWDYKVAADKGYFKIDCLSNRIYRGVRDEAHLDALAAKPPPWDKFEDRTIVERLAQLGDHFDTVQHIKPRNIEDLAVCLALIRKPKRHLKGKPRAEIDQHIWTPSENEDYAFKRSHAIAFAVSLIVQLNLMLETDA